LSILKSAGGAFSRAGCVATNIPATTTNNAVMRAARAEANLVAEVEEVADRARQRVPDRPERALADDDQDADHRDGARRQPDERRHEHHAPAEHPENAGEIVVREAEVEGPGEAEEGELEQDEQSAAHGEEAGERAAVADLASIEEGAGAGEKGEAWRGEVRHRWCP
jgi:hypothetical protein